MSHYVKIGGRIRSMPDNYRRDPFQDVKRHANAQKELAKDILAAFVVAACGAIAAVALAAVMLGLE